jgi:multidrug efflux pump subunit AcrB
MGAAVVMLVIFLTMGLRSSLIVGSALPLVAALSLFGILLVGGELHQMSIFGMIIALGLLIDNAIVVVDEVRKRREAGLGPEDALARTLRHLAGPLFASTLTTTLAFAPIVLLPGNAGDFVGFIGISVILSITGSYAISITVIGALAARLGGGAPAQREARSWWRHGCGVGPLGPLTRRGLVIGLRAPIALMLIASLPALIGFGVAPHLGRQFFPPVERDMFDLRVWLPRPSSIQRTRQVAQAMEDVIREQPEVQRVHWLIGASFPRVYYNLLMNQDRSAFYAQAVIDVTDARATARLVPLLQAELDRRFPQAQPVLRSFGQGPPVDADVQFRVFGPSIERLQRIGDQIRLALQDHPAVLHTRTSLPRGEPKLWFEAGEDETRLAGFSLGDLAGELRGRLDGLRGGSIIEDVEELPVWVRLAGDRRSTVAGVASTNFPQRPGATAPLEALGALKLKPELGGVSRFDSVRCNIIDGYTREGALPIDVTREVQSALDRRGFELPPGYRIELGGSLEQDQEAVGNLAQFAPVLVTIAVAALILTFRSLLLAGILLAVGGLSVGLGLLSTFCIGFPVSFNTILGTLGLIGVAFNDSIVVLAAIREDDRARMGDPQAIASAVLGCSRHVISTTLTTIGGFLPLLLLTEGQFWPSLAIVLAGGVAGASLLAMGFVPGAYRLLVRTDRSSRPTAEPHSA